jgi:hypothetical protein
MNTQNVRTDGNWEVQVKFRILIRTVKIYANEEVISTRIETASRQSIQGSGYWTSMMETLLNLYWKFSFAFDF